MGTRLTSIHRAWGLGTRLLCDCFSDDCTHFCGSASNGTYGTLQSLGPAVQPSVVATSIKKHLNETDGLSRDGSTKKYTNKGSRLFSLPHHSGVTFEPIKLLYLLQL